MHIFNEVHVFEPFSADSGMVHVTAEEEEDVVLFYLDIVKNPSDAL